MPAAINEIVVNTGPLIALDACGQIELLHGLHPRVIVPQAVVTELTIRTHAAGVQVCNIPQWIEVLPLRQAPSPLLQAHLDDGEASVIALAIELGCRLVVIDERRGRQVARLMGLEVTGTVGVLLRAKRQGMLPAVKPCLEAMRSRGVWLSDRLIAFAVAEAGEV